MSDLLASSNLMRQHARAGKIVFGVNHEFSDFQTRRRKVLDLVIARSPQDTPTRKRDLLSLGAEYSIVLSSSQRAQVENLPAFSEGPVGAVLVALEAKAAMTEHSKARPRLYDELTSSHETVHGASSNALAVGLVLVNIADHFVSPDRNREKKRTKVVTAHSQPQATLSVIEKLRELPRRSSDQQRGFDGLGVVLVRCANDGSPITIETAPPAPSSGDVFEYGQMITRVAHEYDARFRNI
jgi:hypothetical protein